MSIEEWENDVGLGWRPLVRELDAKLREIDPDYEILQVKEKFGGLRYYYEDREFNRTMRALVAEAEAESFRVCENCGSGEVRTSADGGYWIKTLCDPCREEKK